MRLNVISTKRIVFATGCLLFIGLLAGSVIAFGQNESTAVATSGNSMATPPPSLTEINVVSNNTDVNATVTSPPSPPSLGGLIVIFAAIVLIVLIPIAIFAWYNKKTLENVLEKNNALSPEDKRESVSTLVKALIPPEPLGMPNGSVRSIIAIVGIGIFAYAVFTFSDSDLRKQLVAALISLISAVVGFYFGARATEEVRTSPADENTPKTPATPTPTPTPTPATKKT